MFSLARSANRTAIRNLRQQTPSACSTRSLLTRSSIAALPCRTLPRAAPAVAQFSTMPALNSSAPSPAGRREFDPEILDMAKYVHEYKIDSDLAVCISVTSIAETPHRCPQLIRTFVVRHGPICLPRYAGLRSRSPPLQGVHEAPGTNCRGHSCSQWYSRARHTLHTRPRQRRLQHRRHDQMARLQRLLASSGMGSPFG